MPRKQEITIGQFSLDGQIFGLEKLVAPPEVIEDNGLKVIHLAISEADNKLPGFTTEAIRQARRLAPEVQSRGKPPWMTAAYQARRREQRATR